MTPEETINAICELYNMLPEHATDAHIELPAEDLHNLALFAMKTVEQLDALSLKLHNAATKNADEAENIRKLLEQY